MPAPNSHRNVAVVALLIAAAIGPAQALAGNGTVSSAGLGTSTTQYVESGDAATKVDGPYGLKPILHLRTYYFDSESLTGSESEAWALGGWAGLATGFLGDVFQAGIVGYVSQKLYGPAGKGGTKILQANQDSIYVVGEAFGAVRLFDQTLIAYRQLVNRPFVNENDSRMVPQIFEGYTVRGAPGGVSYLAGYLTKTKPRDSESYAWMSQAAGAPAAQQGMVIGAITVPFGEQGFVRADEQYVADTFNTFYVDGRYPIALAEATTLALAAQYYSQKSVGSAQLGEFSTWGVGITGVLTWQDVTVQLGYTQMGKGGNSINPYGDHPNYTNLMQSTFSSAGERAWVVGASYEFGSLGAHGLSVGANFASGTDIVTPGTNAPLPNQRETNVRADYRFPKGHALHGLSATIRYSWLDQDGSPQAATQLRAYLNYEVRF